MEELKDERPILGFRDKENVDAIPQSVFVGDNNRGSKSQSIENPDPQGKFM